MLEGPSIYVFQSLGEICLYSFPTKITSCIMGCTDVEYFDLPNWCSAVEMNAWVGVNSYFCRSRSKGIFLVLGQMPTLEYAHNEQLAIECEVHLEANAGVSIVAESNMLLGYTVKRWKPSKTPSSMSRYILARTGAISFFCLVLSRYTAVK